MEKWVAVFPKIGFGFFECSDSQTHPPRENRGLFIQSFGLFTLLKSYWFSTAPYFNSSSTLIHCKIEKKYRNLLFIWCFLQE